MPNDTKHAEVESTFGVVFETGVRVPRVVDQFADVGREKDSAIGVDVTEDRFAARGTGGVNTPDGQAVTGAKEPKRKHANPVAARREDAGVVVKGALRGRSKVKAGRGGG